MSVNIREATANDLPDILALYEEIEDGSHQVLTLAQAQAHFAHFARYPSYRLWVACEAPSSPHASPATTVVGTYALLVMHNLAHKGAPSAIVEDVVVARSRQGVGIGRQMMAHAVQRAREAGCYKLALSSNSRRKGAHAFYESLGFTQHGLSFWIEP